MAGFDLVHFLLRQAKSLIASLPQWNLSLILYSTTRRSIAQWAVPTSSRGLQIHRFRNVAKNDATWYHHRPVVFWHVTNCLAAFSVSLAGCSVELNQSLRKIQHPGRWILNQANQAGPPHTQYERDDASYSAVLKQRKATKLGPAWNEWR